MISITGMSRAAITGTCIMRVKKSLETIVRLQSLSHTSYVTPEAHAAPMVAWRRKNNQRG